MNRYFCVPVALTLFLPSTLVLQQEDSDDHSSGFMVFFVKYELVQEISTSLCEMRCACVTLE